MLVVTRIFSGCLLGLAMKIMDRLSLVRVRNTWEGRLLRTISRLVGTVIAKGFIVIVLCRLVGMVLVVVSDRVVRSCFWLLMAIIVIRDVRLYCESIVLNWLVLSMVSIGWTTRGKCGTI